MEDINGVTNVHYWRGVVDKDRVGYMDGVHVQVLQNSSVMKFVWWEINSGYIVVTKAKN